MTFIAIIVSILAGIAIVIGRIFNSKMAEKMGLFQGASLNYIVGLIISIILTIITGDAFNISKKQFIGIPLWAYLGGILGIAVVVLSSYLVNKVSAFYLTLLIFIGQLVTGMIIDYVISQELSIGKSLGGVLVLIGFLYNLKVDAKEEEVGAEFASS